MPIFIVTLTTIRCHPSLAQNDVAKPSSGISRGNGRWCHHDAHGECLRLTTGTDDLAAGLARMAQFTDAFIAVSNGPLPVLWREDRAIREMAVFPITAVDTLGAGDVFHGAILAALCLGKSLAEATRWANACAALSCRGLDGQSMAPRRAELEAFLAAHPASEEPNAERTRTA
jgi:sugar/nucleoside kinase (ribokinase family)